MKLKEIVGTDQFSKDMLKLRKDLGITGEIVNDYVSPTASWPEVLNRKCNNIPKELGS